MADLYVLALLVATIADILTTEYALKKGYIEGNPVAGFLMAKLGRWWYLPKIALVAVVWVYRDTGSSWAILVLAVFMFAVAANNLRIARQ